MGRRGFITLYGINTLIWSANTYLNWQMYASHGRPISDAHLINMFTMPMLALASMGQLWKLLTSPKPERILDPHATIVIEESLVTRVFRALAIGVFIAAGIWGWVHDRSLLPSIGNFPLLGLAFIGIGLYGLAALIFNPRLRLTITPQSLSFSRLRPSVINWEDLSEVQSRKTMLSTTLTLRLRDHREFRPASFLARWRSVDKLRLNAIMFGVDPDVLQRGIEVRRNVFTF